MDARGDGRRLPSTFDPSQRADSIGDGIGGPHLTSYTKGSSDAVQGEEEEGRQEVRRLSMAVAVVLPLCGCQALGERWDKTLESVNGMVVRYDALQKKVDQAMEIVVKVKEVADEGLKIARDADVNADGKTSIAELVAAILAALGVGAGGVAWRNSASNKAKAEERVLTAKAIAATDAKLEAVSTRTIEELDWLTGKVEKKEEVALLERPIRRP